MARHTVLVELYYSGAWHDHTTDVYQRDPINISSGVTDISQEATPASATFTFDNRTGKMNPMNPTGALVGLIGQNTPVRITIDGDSRFYGEVAQWKPQRAIKGDAWVQATCAGILRRLGRGTDPLHSALRTHLTGVSPHAYWPLEDDTRYSEIAGGGSDGVDSNGTEPQWGKLDGPPGGGKAAQWFVNDDRPPTTQAVFAVDRTGADWTASVWIRALPGTQSSFFSVPVVDFIEMEITGGNGDIALWSIECLSNPAANQYEVTGVTLAADRSLAGTLLTPQVTGINVHDGNWHMITLNVYQVGGNVHGDLTVDDRTDLTSTSSGSGSSGNLINVYLPKRVDAANIQELSLGHLVAFDGDGWSASEIQNRYAAGYGHTSETAGDRFTRLCTENSLSSSVVTLASDTQLMGPQGVATLLQQFDEIERTDLARIYESRTSLGLVMRTGRSMLNQTSALTLDYRTGQIAPPLEPVVGDEHIRNDVSASNVNGGTQRAQQSTGPYNVQAPGAAEGAVGRYATRVEVNLPDDTNLASQAGIRVWFGTFNGTWYENVTVDLDAAPSLRSSVDAITIGDKITLAGLPDDETAGAVDHLIIGISEQLSDQYRRLVTFHLTPADPYTMGILGATNQAGWIDSATTTLNEDLDTTETGVDVILTGDESWTHADGDYAITIGAEDMTVTAVTAVAGTLGSRTQTLTVTRSTNGVVTTHPTGAEVHVRDPFVLSL